MKPESGVPGKFARLLAGVSERCPVCRVARRRQAGAAFALVKTFECVCPFCRCYARVHGRKSHEPSQDDARGVG